MNRASSYRIGLIVLALVAGGIAAAPAAAYADSVCTSGGGTAAQNAACPVTPLNCAPGTAPGWLDVNGNPTSCVDNHPCIVTATQDWFCNPIKPPVTTPAPVPAPVAVTAPAARVVTVAPPVPLRVVAPVKVRPVAARVVVAAPAPVTPAIVTPAPVEPAVIVPAVVSVFTDPWAACDYLICLAA